MSGCPTTGYRPCITRSRELQTEVMRVRIISVASGSKIAETDCWLVVLVC